MTIIDNRTTNRNYKLPNIGNEFPDDVARLIAAFDAVDVDVAELFLRLSQIISLDSPVFTGNPRGPTRTAGDNTASLATTAFVVTALANLLNSPALTGNPTAPTQTLGNNTLRIANTAFVTNAINQLVNAAPGSLDTLKELADALGDDPNFAATMTTALGNRVRFDAAQGLTATQQAQARANIGDVGRNLIVNGQGRINQRGYVSGTATSGANKPTLDRWRVVTSGQNLAFTGDDSKRTMTAPAGGAEQVIEGRNIEGGTYVINWTGTATCTVNGTTRAKGASFTLTANTNATVRFSSGTFTDVQLEAGTVPTAFDRRLYEDELYLCQFHTWISPPAALSGPTVAGYGNAVYMSPSRPMARTPVLSTFASGASSGNMTTGSTDQVSANGFRYIIGNNATGAGTTFGDRFLLDAEP